MTSASGMVFEHGVLQRGRMTPSGGSRPLRLSGSPVGIMPIG